MKITDRGLKQIIRTERGKSDGRINKQRVLSGLDQTIAAQLFEQTTYPMGDSSIDQGFLFYKLDQHCPKMNMIR